MNSKYKIIYSRISIIKCYYLGDFLLSSGLKNHRDHRGHRDKLHRSVLSVYSVVEKLCSNSLFQEKSKHILYKIGCINELSR